MNRAVFYGLLLLPCFVSCNNDEDVNEISIDHITGKYWFHNRWLENKTGFSDEDHIIATKFDRNGTVYLMNGAGREEYLYGTWKSSENQIQIKTEKGEEEWNVLNTKSDRFDVIVNNGLRHLTPEPDYMKGMTVDAFYVNEYRNNEGHVTYLDARITGQPGIRESLLIMDDQTNYNLRNYGYYWGVNRQKKEIEMKVEERDLKFYLQIGHSHHLKFRDHLYATNLPKRLPMDFDLQATNPGGASSLKVTWKPFDEDHIYYRIEVLNADKDPINPYFVSLLQGTHSSSIIINENSAGSHNRISELKSGEHYVVRLAAILYEPKVDPINDRYGEGNIQAITYTEKRIIWE